MQAAQPIVFERDSDTSHAQVEIMQGGWNALGFYSTYPAMVRQFSNNVSVSGFHFVNGGSWVDMRPPIAGNVFSGFTFDHAYGFGLSGGQVDGVWHEFRNYSATNAQVDGGFWSNVWQRFINPAQGSDLIIVGYATNSSNNKGLCEARKEVSITVRDTAGFVEGAKVWIPDTDDGRSNLILRFPCKPLILLNLFENLGIK